MENQPLISVIVPVYNVEQYLPRCLDSIINQTYTNLEILLIDDGSTDNSGKICDEYALKDNRIRVFHKENGGVSSARNLALKNLKGEYVAFVDSDDSVLPDYIEVSLRCSIDNNADICRCGFYSNDEELKQNEKEIKIEVIEKDNFSFCADYNVSTDTIGGAFIKATSTKNVFFDTDLYIAEDSFFIAKVLKRAKSIALIHKKLYFYFRRNDSALRVKKFTSKRYTELVSWKRICELFIDQPKIQETCFAAYALRCRLIIEKYYDDTIFKKDYYMQTLMAYRENYRFVKKYLAIGIRKKLIFALFYFSPRLFLLIKTNRDKN